MRELTIISGIIAFIGVCFAIYVHFTTKDEIHTKELQH